MRAANELGRGSLELMEVAQDACFPLKQPFINEGRCRARPRLSLGHWAQFAASDSKSDGFLGRVTRQRQSPGEEAL